MNKALRRFAPAFAVLIFSCLALGDDFKSMTITIGSAPVVLPKIHADQFMVIRNFTQDGFGSGTRGFVTVSVPLQPDVSVLAAAIIDPSSSSVDVINNIVIAGPASVTVTCDPLANCFISFKKDSN